MKAKMQDGHGSYAKSKQAMRNTLFGEIIGRRYELMGKAAIFIQVYQQFIHTVEDNR
jgi:hypothetical protein